MYKKGGKVMNCEQINEKLSLYIDEMLSDEEMAEIRSHLHNCPACDSEYKALLETIKMLSSMEEIIPPASFRRELRQKLEKASSNEVVLEEKFVKRVFKKEQILKYFNRFRRSWLMPVSIALILMVIIIPPLMNNLSFGSAMKSDMAAESVEMKEADNGISDYQMFSASKGITKSPNEAPKMKKDGAPSLNNEMQRNEDLVSKNKRKIIKNADLSLKVDNYDTIVQRIKNQVDFLGGYIANENISKRSTGNVNGHLQIRIPHMSFEGFLDQISELGDMTSRNIYTQDVTEEYVDVESRLKALRIKETRLLDLLAKSGKLSDVLAVENELANARAELESLQGRLRYLDDRTDFSNINISIQQRQSSNQQISPGGLAGVWLVAKQAFIESINELIGYLRKFIILIGALLPYIVLILVFVAAIWYYLKRKKDS